MIQSLRKTWRPLLDHDIFSLSSYCTVTQHEAIDPTTTHHVFDLPGPNPDFSHPHFRLDAQG